MPDYIRFEFCSRNSLATSRGAIRNADWHYNAVTEQTDGASMNQHTAFRAVVQMGLLFAMAQGTRSQEVSVECPGGAGKVRCEFDQVAVCWINDGSSLERCLTPPEGVNGLALDLWLLSYVLDDTITVTESSVESFREIIRKGMWEGGAYKVAFSLPGTWRGSR
jgi:hypothetical protein